MLEDSELIPKRPGEQVIVFDPGAGGVMHSDFPPVNVPADREVDASDILDFSNNADLGFVISAAMGMPGKMVESECSFRGKMAHVRVLLEEFSPSTGPTSGGILRLVAWRQRVQVLIQYMEK